jgi:aerobic-type carbon monoxide dehydrogenase small subunit (CoxS/CutS family)
VSDRRRIEVEINGRPYARDVEPRLLLSDFIRHEAGLTGTHVGCEHGVCGACTVQLDGDAVRSCLLLAVQAHGRRVRTVEGMTDGLPAGELHPLQQAFQDLHALQCGFCTPGILMSIEQTLSEDRELSDTEIREALAGNLCRCTGYQNVVAAVALAHARVRGETLENKRESPRAAEQPGP